MNKKKKLYEVKLALDGNINDTVKILAEKLESIPKEHKILSYKPIKKQK